MTYTYTRYHSPDDIQPLQAAAEQLRGHAEDLIAEGESRIPYIDAEAADAMRLRHHILTTAIDLLDNAITALTEPVPRPYGG